jgi:para-aminobenzoate synthetase
MQYYKQNGQKLPSHLTRASRTKPVSSNLHSERTAEGQDDYTVISQKLPFQGDPASIFQEVFSQYPSAVWLDSSQIIPGFSRFSYMGALLGPLAYQLSYDAHTQTTTQIQEHSTTTYPMSIFAYLKEALQRIKIKPAQNLPFDFHGGFIGYFGYELNQETACISDPKRSPHPDAQWLFLDRFIAFDHQEQCCYVVAVSSQDEMASNTAWLQALCETLHNISEITPSSLPPYPVQGSWLQSPADYRSRIQDCLDYIDSGDSYEICLTNKLQFSYQIDPFRYYINLRHCHPAPHAAFFKFSDLAIACSSMERFLKIDQHRQIETKPIKGTLPRGKTVYEDQQLAQDLQDNIKFRSEHLMIVDLLRNDLGKICQIESITVPDLMQVETYATVHQLVSRITGHLQPDVHGIDCIQHTFPGGSMTGAPKIRSMVLLNQVETQARGIYSGSLGYISLNGAIDLNIVIRTAEIMPHQISMGAGGAIVALSDIEEEFAEMDLKTRALQTALGVTLHEQDRLN